MFRVLYYYYPLCNVQAMHLIYKALENHPLPQGGLPPEMISSARRAGVAGPVPAPLAPPAGQQQEQQLLLQQQKQQVCVCV